MKKAEDRGKYPLEAVRLIADSVSCMSDITFLCQAMSNFNNKVNKDNIRNGKFYTLPIKLSFPNRSARVHFEWVMYLQSDMKVLHVHPAAGWGCAGHPQVQIVNILPNTLPNLHQC
jgi:hypothetical protein